MAVDVILRDGATLRLRAPVEGDVPGLVEFFAAALGAKPLPTLPWPRCRRRAVRSAPSSSRIGPRRGALIGVMGEVGEERIVAVGNYVRLRDPSTAEAAFAVADDFQRRGVGSRLLEQLARRASAHGIESFIAEVLAENRAMLSVFENIGFVPTRTLDGGVVEVRFPIEATEGYRARVDERDHVAVAASLRPFFEPTTMAVIGASARPGSIGGLIFRNVLSGGFTGAAYPVNRSGEPVAGVRAYRSLEEIGDPIDLCVICLPGEHVIGAAEEALRAGTRALCVISAGFAETGPAGHRAAGAPARSRPSTWCAARRPELPRNRDGRRRNERDLRTARVPRRAGSASRLSPVRSASHCSSAPRPAGSASPASSRSGTRQTSPPTTSSSGGRTTPTPTSSSSTSSPSATHASSRASPAGSRVRSPFWR